MSKFWIALIICLAAVGGWFLSKYPLTATARYELGLRYAEGRGGVPQNYEKAVFWFRKAAEQGDPTAQYVLGVCYFMGQGVAEDDQIGAMWIRKAAEQGQSDAQFALGGLYSVGKGVAKDSKQSDAWIQKALAQGNANAKQYWDDARRNSCIANLKQRPRANGC